MAGEG
ncbi:hypothetical protein YPPY65_3031, partial [Yersinia pestis PY-65]